MRSNHFDVVFFLFSRAGCSEATSYGQCQEICVNACSTCFSDRFPPEPPVTIVDYGRRAELARARSGAANPCSASTGLRRKHQTGGFGGGAIDFPLVSSEHLQARSRAGILSGHTIWKRLSASRHPCTKVHFFE